MAAPAVEQIGDGVYRVAEDDRTHTVYVTQRGTQWWAFADGRVFQGDLDGRPAPARRARSGGGTVTQAVTAPMPATVLRVLVAAGDRVARGDTLILLEAMKMELPLRSASEGTVQAVHCREGELVQPDSVLVDLV